MSQNPPVTQALPADHAGPPGLDLGRLRPYLEERGLTSGPIQAEVFHGGRSNLTYLVHDGTRRYVVRRPPLGHVLATAHDMAREYRVMTALRGTGVPVPVTHALCQDEKVIGAPFYVMECVAGAVLTPGSPRFLGQPLTLDADDPIRKIVLDLTDVLARLHSLDYDELGLGDFGRPDGYLERQVRRWKRQLDSSRSRDVSGIDELSARLAAELPRSGPAAIVHGDAANPRARHELEAKFRALASEAVDAARVNQIVEMVAKLEQLPDVRALTALLSPAP